MIRNADFAAGFTTSAVIATLIVMWIHFPPPWWATVAVLLGLAALCALFATRCHEPSDDFEDWLDEQSERQR